ncbi:hypothetical protein HY990_05320 [Candidatus Micrarchaeota archaeon]|nr:hypothetical protein [Candidatus Micrarchaeota archaeon]
MKFFLPSCLLIFFGLLFCGCILPQPDHVPSRPINSNLSVNVSTNTFVPLIPFDSSCKSCQYLNKDGICTNYDCCFDSDCSAGYECTSNRCIPISVADTKNSTPIADSKDNSTLMPASNFSTISSCINLSVSGPPTEKLNIIFVPSRYYTDLSQFLIDANLFRSTLLNFSFYANNSAKMNFFALSEADSGDGCMTVSGTPSCNISNVKSHAHRACSYSQERGDQLVVLFDNSAVNTSYARGEVDDDIVFIGSYGSSVFVHEFSHSFGNLADTYEGYWNNTANPIAANCASEVPGFTCEEKWGDLIGTGEGDNRVGCFRNCHAENWFRPTSGGDIMYNAYDLFYDPVSLRHMERMMSGYR